MKKFIIFSLALLMVFSLSPVAFATNGDNLIGVGAKSRAMGGVGIAAPQDAISAVFANPAAMCFGPYCPGSEFNFDATAFMPKVSSKIKLDSFVSPLGPLPGATIKDKSDEKIYPIPAIGISSPINPKLRFGLAAYGVSGLGVDYRESDLDVTYGAALGLPPGSITDPSGNEIPLAAGTYTNLQIMKFSPNVAYLVNDNLSIGAGLHVAYSNLDLGDGSSFNYGLGTQFGAIYKATDMVILGATFITGDLNDVKHENVADFDGDGKSDDLTLNSPLQVGAGIAFQPMDDTLLIELDGKWINWSGAKGYDDFDWIDQYVIAVGGQYKVNKQFAIRAGYNYGSNPVKEHDDFESFDSLGNPTTKEVQGKDIPTYYYETFRIVGFPAIVGHHVTLGAGYEFSKTFVVNLGYMYALEATIEEKGQSVIGQPATLESKLSEHSLDLGLTWRF